MKTIKFTGQELMEKVMPALTHAMQVPHQVNNKFAAGVSKNYGRFESVHKRIMKQRPLSFVNPTIGEPKEMSTYRKEFMLIQHENCEKDQRGSFIQKENQLVPKDVEKYNKAVEAVNKKFKGLLDKVKASEKEFEKVMKQTFEVEIHQVEESNIPPLPGNIYGVLEFMIVTDGRIMGISQ